MSPLNLWRSCFRKWALTDLVQFFIAFPLIVKRCEKQTHYDYELLFVLSHIYFDGFCSWCRCQKTHKIQTPSLGPTWERGCITYIFVALSIFRVLTHATNNHCKTHGLCVGLPAFIMSPDHPLRSGLNNLHLGKNAFTDALAKPLIQSMGRLKNPLVTWPSYRLLGADCIPGPKVSAGLTRSRNPFTSKYLKCLYLEWWPELNTCTAEIEVKY